MSKAIPKMIFEFNRLSGNWMSWVDDPYSVDMWAHSTKRVAEKFCEYINSKLTTGQLKYEDGYITKGEKRESTKQI